MKLLLRLSFLILLFSTTYTTEAQNYARVDSILKTYPNSFKTLENLSDKIASDFLSDEERVRVVFNWIANNVVYDINESGVLNRKNYDTYDQEVYLKRFNHALAKRVLNKKRAVCQGYSSLLSELCNNLNIKNVIVTGAAKTSIRKIARPARSNHAWNIVEISNKKYLIDATWGSGSMDGDTFYQETNYNYFFTPPDIFINENYPDDYENSLLEIVITKKQFSNAPVINRRIDDKYQLISPSKFGTLKANNPTFKISTEVPIIRVSYLVNNKYFLEVENFVVENGILSFDINLNDNNIKTILIYINSKDLVGYKVI